MIYKILILISVLILTGCDARPEKHIIYDNGTERGVEIEVLLKGGGTATLICPKFNSKPRGSHGRECYLREYDNTKYPKVDTIK
tara:strand:+ start:510 stop:761 length:252 start_codon:yes stop_codon:yes gene_type:complete